MLSIRKLKRFLEHCGGPTKISNDSKLHHPDVLANEHSSSSIYTVCDDIMLLILKMVIGSPAVNVKKWKLQLPLLAVCRNWRRLALPLIYSQVFLYLNTRSKKARSSYTKFGNQSILKQYHISNVGLAVGNTACHYAKTIYIFVHKPMNALDMYRTIINLLNFQMASWPNVKSLRLELGQNVLETLNSTCIDSQVFLSMLYRNFKKLTELDINAFGSEHGVECNFLNELTDTFIPQLTKLSVDTNLTLQRFPQSLTKLELNMLPLSIQNLPTINPYSLQQLSIFDVVPGFKWNIFAANDRGSIEFSSLRKLSIGYSTDIDPNASNKQARLSFPNLKQLSIFHCPKSCNLLSKSLYSKKLEKLIVHCANGIVPSTASQNIVPCKQLLFLVSAIDDGHNNMYYQVTNNIFKSSRLSDNPGLVILNKQAVPNLALINWANLSSLSLCTSITTTTLLSLLDKLPKLQELTVKFLISNHWQNRADAKSLDYKCVSDNDCLKISFLSINFALDPKVTEMDISFIFYLLAVSKLLRSVKSSPSLILRIKGFANSHSNIYPHFEDLSLASL